MKYILILLVAGLFPAILFGQQSKTDQQLNEIIETGKTLYRSETASWTATDTFLTRHPELINRSGGYFSYEKDNIVYCICWRNYQ